MQQFSDGTQLFVNQQFIDYKQNAYGTGMLFKLNEVLTVDHWDCGRYLLYDVVGIAAYVPEDVVNTMSKVEGKNKS